MVNVVGVARLRQQYSYGVADQNVVTSKMLGFVERFIRFFNSVPDIAIRQRRNADTDGNIGGNAFVKHMRDFKIVYFLSDTLCGSAGLLWFGGGQQHQKFFTAKTADDIARSHGVPNCR